MKNNLQTNALLLKIIILFTCFMLVMLYNQTRASDLPSVSRTSSRVSVNFKHNVEKNELSVSISGKETGLKLFIFTTDGILMRELAVSSTTIATIQGLNKGYYLYECFRNDDRMKSGSLLIR
jgi:hypothetical protein